MARFYHRLVSMTGRDPHQRGRVATTLELFFDLTFVVVFSLGGVQLAHYLSIGHFRTATLAFAFCALAGIWAWINFTWMSSAFDTDDWLFRLVTMLQMVGVCILALGIEPVFRTVDAGTFVDDEIIVAGYVVMRVALLFQWMRVAVQSEEYRATAMIYIASITVAQIGWIISAVAHLSLGKMVVAAAILWVVELAGPVLAERRKSTPWHAHHVAERYGLLVIITLGEGIVGTVTVLQAVVGDYGWSVDAAVFGLTGIAINFCMWWIYFAIPTADILHAHPEKCFPWGYGHAVVYLAIAAFGAGLHVAALQIEHEATISTWVVTATIAGPVAVYLLSMLAMYGYLVGASVRTTAVFVAALAVLVLSVAITYWGTSVVAAMIVIVIAAALVVLYDELTEAHDRAEKLSPELSSAGASGVSSADG